MNNTKHKRLLQILLLLLTVCVVLFIFSNSRENAAESSSRSQQLTRFINYALRSVNLPWRVTEHLVRKAAHFLEYALLGFFVALTAASFTARKLLRGMIAFPACLLVAVIDENIPRFSSGRTPSRTDVLIDFCGSSFGICFAIGILIWVLYITHKYALPPPDSQDGEPPALS